VLEIRRGKKNYDAVFFDAEGRRFYMIFYVFPTFGGKALSYKLDEICAEAFFLTLLIGNWEIGN
jgi:hypothetical protein